LHIRENIGEEEIGLVVEGEMRSSNRGNYLYLVASGDLYVPAAKISR